MNEPGDSEDELRQSIAQTRARLASDLEALTARLNVAYAKEKFVETLHEAKELVKDEAIEAKDELIARATSAAVLAVPLGLLGVGACWLAARALREPPRLGSGGRDGPGLAPSAGSDSCGSEDARERSDNRRASTWSLGLVAVAAGLSLGLFLPPPSRPPRPPSPG
jgi:hypothetical protein